MTSGLSASPAATSARIDGSDRSCARRAITRYSVGRHAQHVDGLALDQLESLLGVEARVV